MKIEKEYKGKWWLPTRPVKEIDGTLTINTNGSSTLEIRDTLIEQDLSVFPSVIEKVEIILGRASDGLKLTLVNCQLYGTLNSSEGFPLQSIKVETSIFNAHFSSNSEISFKKLNVRFKHLEYLIKSTRMQLNNPLETKELIIGNILPEITHLFSIDNFNIDLVITVESHFGYHLTKKITIQDKASISIETASNERNFEDFLKIIEKLKYFFTFCVLKTVYPIEITGESFKSIWTPPLDRKTDGKPIFEKIIIISHWVDLPDSTQIDEVDRNEILFTLTEIRDNSEVILGKWWIKHDVFKSIFDIYFGTIFNSMMYLENAYLSLAQCIESYHRKSPKFLNYRIRPEEYNERIDLVKESLESQRKLTKSQKKSLISILKKGNSLSLENRIEQLLLTYPTIRSIIAGAESNLPSTIALNRNNLTHLDPKPEIHYANFEELYYLSIRMRLLLITVFLDELGFEVKKIQQIIVRLNRHYRLK